MGHPELDFFCSINQSLFLINQEKLMKIYESDIKKLQYIKFMYSNFLYITLKDLIFKPFDQLDLTILPQLKILKLRGNTSLKLLFCSL